MASDKDMAFLLGKDAHHYTSAPVDETDDESTLGYSDHAVPRPPSFARRASPILTHVVILAMYSIVFVVVWKRTQSHDSLGIPYVDTVFEVKPKLNDSIARIYSGTPSAELDEAWNELLQHSNIRVPERTIRDLGRLDEAVRFTDGSGYFAQMTVYHHLHCIKRLHHFLHYEHYWPNATPESLALLRAHNYHCLDTLRQAIMCQGDTALITYRFGTSQPIPLANFSSSHKCRGWEALDAWNENHFVNVFEPGLVVHPTLGPSYTHVGEGPDIGVVVDE